MNRGTDSIVHNNDHSSDIQHRTVDTSTPPGSPQTNIRPRWTHNPVVLAALACSNMQSCEDVSAIYKECQKNQSDSMVCEAATKYYRMCHLNSDKDNSILLDFNPYRE